jgi:hypothetical protein
MRTGCIFTATGPGRIVVARFVPRGFWTLPRATKLAPPAWLIRETDRPTFLRHYHAAVLSKLDAATIWIELHERVAPHEPILLCYERLATSGEWCHREVLAAWFRDQLGHDVPELGAATRTSPQ